MRATVLAIADELTEHGLVLRYRVDETEDGLSGREGTFTICSFWLVSALSEIGERERARKLCAAAAHPRDAARPLRGGDRGAERRPARQLPAGLHAPGADQRGLARDRRRAAGASGRSRAPCSPSCGRPGRPAEAQRSVHCGGHGRSSSRSSAGRRRCGSSSCPDPEPADGEVVVDVARAGHQLRRHPRDPQRLPRQQELPLIPAARSPAAPPTAAGSRRSSPAAATPSGWPCPRRSWSRCRTRSPTTRRPRCCSRASPRAACCGSRPGSSRASPWSSRRQPGGPARSRCSSRSGWAPGRVIALASSEDKRELALRLGADAAVDSRADDLEAAILEANGGEPVDVVLEMSGGEAFEACLRGAGAVRPPGHIRARLAGAGRGPKRRPDADQPRRRRLLAHAPLPPPGRASRGDRRAARGGRGGGARGGDRRHLPALGGSPRPRGDRRAERRTASCSWIPTR